MKLGSLHAGMPAAGHWRQVMNKLPGPAPGTCFPHPGMLQVVSEQGAQNSKVDTGKSRKYSGVSRYR
jgi:hypothetical protein